MFSSYIIIWLSWHISMRRISLGINGLSGSSLKWLTISSSISVIYFISNSLNALSLYWISYKGTFLSNSSVFKNVSSLILLSLVISYSLLYFISSLSTSISSSISSILLKMDRLTRGLIDSFCLESSWGMMSLEKFEELAIMMKFSGFYICVRMEFI